jgi:large conductance mechanosensitive channel
MNGKIRTALGRAGHTVRRLATGSRQFISAELDKFKKFSKHLTREIVALFVMAIVAGIALSSLIKSFVFDLFMPLIGLISPHGDWRNLGFTIGRTRFNLGNFLANLTYFIFVLLIVFLILKLMPSRPELSLRHLLKNCPSCGELLPPDAQECPRCGTRFLELREGQ